MDVLRVAALSLLLGLSTQALAVGKCERLIVRPTCGVTPRIRST